MDLDEKLRGLARFGSTDALKSRLARPLDFLGEPPIALLPSIQLGSDGPFLRSLFIFTEHEICEVHLTGKDSQEFDFVSKRHLLNYRFTFSTHDVSKDDRIIASFNLVEVTLRHSDAMYSQLSYVGDDPESWLSELRHGLSVAALSLAK